MNSTHLSVEEHRLQAFCEEHGVERLLLYGSARRGELSQEGDIDLVVDFLPGRGVGFIGLAAMATELEDLFGRRVDLNTPGSFSPRFAEMALADAEPLYEHGT